MLAARRLHRIALLATAAAFVSCNDSPTDARPGPPAALDIVGGDGQEGIAGAELNNPLVVRVEDANGQPVVGQLVNFRVTAGGGNVFAGAAITNALGIAQERWTLGTSTADSQRVEARAIDPDDGSRIVFATFRATARPGPAQFVTRIGGHAQQGVLGAALAESLAVRVTDLFGNPVPGVAVGWTVALNNGTVSPASSQSNAQGVTKAMWTIGARLDGPHSASATVPSLSPGVFSATVTLPASARIEKVSGDAQTGAVGQPLADSLVARVVLANGTPVQGALLTWQVVAGGGSSSIDTARTDANGRARIRWTLGSGGGVNRVRVSRAPLADVEFTATAQAPQGSALSIVSGDGQSGRVANSLGQPMVVRLAGPGGQPIAGVGVTWTVVEGNGVLGTPSTVATDADGLSRMQLRLGSTAGANRVSAAAPGTNAVTFGHTGRPGLLDQVTAIGLPASATVGTAVGPFHFRVADLYGNPIPGYNLTWTMLPPPGQLGGQCGRITSEPSDANGLARSFWELCSTPGQQSGYHLGPGAVKHQFVIQGTP